MTGSAYNVAIVGTGRIIDTHVKALRKVPGLEIAGVFGRDRGRTLEVASRLELRAFKDYEEILSDPEIEIVDIITSSDLHASYGIEAVERGKDLIIEKPIDVSVEKAEELVRLCERNRRLLGVIYQRRFDESTRLLKDLLGRGAFGRLLSCNITSRFRRDMAYYREATDGSKGVLINNGIHYIDLIIYLLGTEPVACRGVLEKTRPGLVVEDTAKVTLEFRDSFTFTLDMSTNVEKSQPTIIELTGEKGSIVFSGDKILSAPLGMVLGTVPWKKSNLKLYFSRKHKTPFRFTTGTHEDVFRNYAAALKGEEAVSVDGPAAIASLRVVKEIYESSQ